MGLDGVKPKKIMIWVDLDTIQKNESHQSKFSPNLFIIYKELEHIISSVLI